LLFFDAGAVKIWPNDFFLNILRYPRLSFMLFYIWRVCSIRWIIHSRFFGFIVFILIEEYRI